jgi:glycosyltransferase involved in cell wall biosynthesis
MVSVIMPVRNEGKAIRRSLQAVLAQDYPSEKLEVLVADGMSNDGTRDILQAIAAQDARVRIVDNPARIMASGFNKALGQARGEFIVMMGGHTEIAPNYVSTCVSALQQGLAECAGGSTETQAESDWAEAIALALSSRFGVGPVAFRVGCAERKYVDTVAFGAYSRRIIDQIGVLDEELVRNQDDEFNYRLRKEGGRILLLPGIPARYTSRATLRSLWNQYFQYGYWKVRVLQKHPRQMQPRQFAPALFVSALALSLLAWCLAPGAKWLVVMLGGLYLSTSLAASLAVASRSRKWRLLALLPAVFATLHFAYGFGFLAGLAHFWKRWQVLRPVRVARRGAELSSGGAR